MGMMVLGHLGAVLIGLSLGLMGGGGSILAVPVLVYIMGLPPKTAIAMSLVMVGIVSLLSAMPHWRMGNIRFKIALIFGTMAMLGSYIGAKIATLPIMSDNFQMSCFSITMVVAAGLMIRKSSRSTPLPPPSSSAQQWRWLWIALEGMGVGMLTGLVGVGGGFAIVPALVLLGNVPIKEATGTSLLIITLNAITGFLVYLNHVTIDWTLLTSFTIAAIGGAMLGVYFVPKIKSQHLQKSFGYVLLAVAGFVLWHNGVGY